MNLSLTAPSKTFLSGEYACLEGAPALILNTQPRFELRASRPRDVQDEGLIGISKSSPAGVWLREREPLLLGWRLEFVDPHAGRGGLGASSAQYLLAHAFTTLLQRDFIRLDEDPKDLLHDFRVVSGGHGSGADVLAQSAGLIARVDVGGAESSPEEWPYPEIGFMVLRTGQKLATHEHLRDLDRSKLEPLMNLAKTCFDSFDAEPAANFLVQVNRYGKMLRQLGLQASHTVEMLERIEQEPWCLAAKGCGAMGADTMLVFFPQIDGQLARERVASLGLELVATDVDLSAGMEWSK